MIVYLAGRPEEGDEYVEAKTKLEAKGHQVVCNPSPEPNLRIALGDLLYCDAIHLMELWWADLQATQLQTVASWLGLKHVDTAGECIPTGGLRNLR
jgi:hypothetical protein